MDGSAPTVASREYQGERATFKFEDGHTALFDGYIPNTPAHQIAGLRVFTLLDKKDKMVAEYRCRMEVTPWMHCDEEHRLIRTAPGYSTERIASYWQAALAYVEYDFHERPREEGRAGAPEIWPFMRMIEDGDVDLALLADGRTPALVTLV